MLALLRMLSFCACVATASAQWQQRPDVCPFPAPRLEATDPCEVAWAARNIAGEVATVNDDLRRTLARLRRPRDEQEERALLFVLDALVRFGAVVPVKELDFRAEGLLQPVRIRLLLANPDAAATQALEAAFVELDTVCNNTWEGIGDALLARRSSAFACTLVEDLTRSVVVSVGEADAGESDPGAQTTCWTEPEVPRGWPALPMHLWLRHRPEHRVQAWAVSSQPGRRVVTMRSISGVCLDPDRVRVRWLSELLGEQPAGLPMAPVVVAAGHFERGQELVAQALARAGELRQETLRRLVSRGLPASASAMRAPEVWVEDHRPAAERTAKPLRLPDHR